MHFRPARTSSVPTSHRRVLGRLLALAVALVVLVPAAASAVPIEDFATYDPQTNCSPNAKPGTLKLSVWLQKQYPGSGSLGISRSCNDGGVSEHKEGRAFDWAVNVELRPRPGVRGRLLREDLRHRRRGQPRRAGPPDGHHVPHLERPHLLVVLRLQGPRLQGLQGAQLVLRHAAAPQPRAHLAEPGRRQRPDQLVHRRDRGAPDRRPTGRRPTTTAPTTTGTTTTGPRPAHHAGRRAERAAGAEDLDRHPGPAQAAVRHRHGQPEGRREDHRLQAAQGLRLQGHRRRPLRLRHPDPGGGRVLPLVAGRARLGALPGHRRGPHARLAEPARQRQADQRQDLPGHPRLRAAR